MDNRRTKRQQIKGVLETISARYSSASDCFFSKGLIILHIGEALQYIAPPKEEDMYAKSPKDGNPNDFAFRLTTKDKMNLCFLGVQIPRFQIMRHRLAHATNYVFSEGGFDAEVSEYWRQVPHLLELMIQHLRI